MGTDKEFNRLAARGVATSIDLIAPIARRARTAASRLDVDSGGLSMSEYDALVDELQRCVRSLGVAVDAIGRITDMLEHDGAF